MKIIYTFGDKEYPISDEEATKLQAMLNSGNRPHSITTRKGETVTVSAISGVGEPIFRSYWKGWPLSKAGTSFMRDGVRVYLEPHNMREVVREMDEQHRAWALEIGETTKPQIESAKESVSSYAGQLTGKFKVN